MTDQGHKPENVDGRKKRWEPNRTRKVRSKKSYDQKKMEHLVSDDKPVYRGELDPRQKEPDRKPRSISFSEQKVMNKAARLAELEAGDDAAAKLVSHSDFREFYEHNSASPGRLAALYATQQVRRRNAFAQQIIEASIDTSKLAPEDRAFATLLTLGVVSTSGALDNVINRCIQSPRDIKPDVRDAIRISTYEIIFLKKAPHAAVDQGVELVRAVAPSAANLGNAVLHRILECSDKFPFGDPKTDIEALALMCAFPVWLAKQLVNDLGAQAAYQLMQASNKPAPLYIHVNSLQATDAEIVDLFAEVGCELKPGSSGGIEVAGCFLVPNARSLADGRIQRLFSQGKILASDASAQSVASCVLEGEKPSTVLEVGAGRGTKTIMLQSLSNAKFGEQLTLTCMDSHGFKTDLLRDRAKQYGVDVNDFVTGNAARLDAIMGDRSFDMIFIDAPCSGLGTLRRHHEIRWRLQPEQVTELANVQLSLLKSAAGHVNEGGHIVYSTCTVTYEENNGVVKSFLESEEGKGFKLVPVNGKACFTAQLTDGSPDAHFCAKFERVG